MPAAQDKAALIAVTEKDFAKLAALIAKVGEEAALRKREEDTSIKDVIAHRAHWIDLFLGWYADGQAGREVHMPAKGYKWSDLKAYNAALRETQAGMGWEDARSELAAAHGRLMALIDILDDAALYGAPMPGGGASKWALGRYAEASGASHYRSAAKFIRAALRADAEK
ncbi:MAG: ClbS/DfsB family four-helix bundle protein [Pseudomonadota bacterium]